MQTLVEKINKLKKEKNAIILAHCYQRLEIDTVADFVGDSLGLSRQAANTDADMIIFAGVYFMAQTAKILSPKKRVFLPNMKSGCQMADMINLAQIKEFKAKHFGVPVVGYVNSTAEVKTECDICCTSSNAVKIVKNLAAQGVKKVLFVPDAYLGSWVAKNCPEIEVITYPGYCPTHLKITPDDILKLCTEYPDAPVLAHPECHGEVLKLANFVGSTTQIIERVSWCDGGGGGEPSTASTTQATCDKVAQEQETFIIGTEIGVLERLQRDYPHKKFILASSKTVCPNMKHTTLEDILYVLENAPVENEIFVDEKTRQKALLPIEKMVN